MKKFNSNNFKYFVAVGDTRGRCLTGGSHTLSRYIDWNNALKQGVGKEVSYVLTKDPLGKTTRFKYFTFNDSHLKFATREGEKDANGISQYDFLKNHPECEGSPNGNYDSSGKQVGVTFRELNDAADAEDALKADTARIKAQGEALDLDKEILEQVATHIGLFPSKDDKSNKVMRVRVVDFAGRSPKEFTDILNAGDLPIRAIVKKAIADGTFTMRGTVIYWDETVIGSGISVPEAEQAAVASLLSDKTMLKPLQEKYGFKVKSTGRPKLAEQENQ